MMTKPYTPTTAAMHDQTFDRYQIKKRIASAVARNLEQRLDSRDVDAMEPLYKELEEAQRKLRAAVSDITSKLLKQAIQQGD